MNPYLNLYFVCVFWSRFYMSWPGFLVPMQEMITIVGVGVDLSMAVLNIFMPHHSRPLCNIRISRSNLSAFLTLSKTAIANPSWFASPKKNKPTHTIHKFVIYTQTLNQKLKLNKRGFRIFKNHHNTIKTKQMKR